jgi:predicted metalloprotease with PDZ domain
MRSIADVVREHIKTNGGVPRENAMLMLTTFPRAAGASRWSAETRGGTTLLLLGQSFSRAAALAGLSVPLAHELFHLWIPNGVALDGHYDWFYEGFTQYQALRTSVRLGTLTFQEFLDAIGGAFDAYRAMIDRDKYSLVEASERRWTGAPGIVYHKGLLTAFLYDLTLREKTGGKRSLDDVYRELFRSYRRTDARTDSNAAVIKTLSEALESPFFARQYVTSASTIDLSSGIAPFGLTIEQGGVRTRLAIADSPTRKQRDLLRQLGYNSETHLKSRRVERKKEK